MIKFLKIFLFLIFLLMPINGSAIEEIEPIKLGDLKKGILVPREDFEGWLKRFDWTYHQLARNEFPGQIKNLAEFQLDCICSDPVLWCGAFLKDPDYPDNPWRFFDYQKESARYPGNTLHECGAEVGKTREIVGLSLYKAFTRQRGSGLITAPMLTHLMEIIDAIKEQLSFRKEMEKALILHRKYPHNHFKFENGFIIDFRPMGYDGEALRGVHAKTFIKADEITKAKNPDIFKELWRAGKPHCVFKLYSVPDGDRSCVFYRLCQRADGISPDNKVEEDANESKLRKKLKFKKFHWSKELMPDPFWNNERRRFYIEQYGGEDSPGYQQNVLGNWGDPENSVFPWYQFQRCLKDIPEYRVLKILVDDSQDEVSLFGAEYKIIGGQGSGVRDQEDDRDQGAGVRGQKTENKDARPEEVIICDRKMSKATFDIKAEIKAFFSNVHGLKFGGVDLGFSRDPSEIIIKLIIGKHHRRIARLNLKGVSYDMQADAIDAIDDIYDGGEMKMGWGLDFGNAGSAVCHILQNQELYAEKKYDNRLTGYWFESTYDSVDEEGETIINKRTGKPVKLTAKELSTDTLVKKLQRQELEYPYDNDTVINYPNHTYRMGQKHRIYRKKDDHEIDADRVLMLKILFPDDGAGDDVFA